MLMEALINSLLLFTIQNTSVGRFAIQLAKLSGLRVATTASKNFDRLKALGADLIVNYKAKKFNYIYINVNKSAN